MTKKDVKQTETNPDEIEQKVKSILTNYTSRSNWKEMGNELGMAGKNAKEHILESKYKNSGEVRKRIAPHLLERAKELFWISEYFSTLK